MGQRVEWLKLSSQVKDIDVVEGNMNLKLDSNPGFDTSCVNLSKWCRLSEL